MLDLVYQQWAKLLVIFLLILIGTLLTRQATASAGTEPKTLSRDLEPVVVKSSQVVALSGTPTEDIFVYIYTGTGWEGQIPMQVDEIASDGSYLAVENGLPDSNDEIVFMAGDLGNRAPDTEPLTAMLPISNTWYEIQVMDPTDPDKKGWGLYRSLQRLSFHREC